MVRKEHASTLGLGVTLVTLSVLRSMGVVPGIPPAGAAQPVAAQSSGQPVLRETFDDDTTGGMWSILAEDPGTCTVKEVNHRFELEASKQSADASAGYVSKGWRLDPRRDFSMKVDYHYDLVDYAEGWMSFGVVTDAASPWERNAVVGVGCRNGLANYWWRKQTGLSVDTSFAQRSPAAGTLYISYDASVDELYLGFSGYGPDAAWATLPGLLRQQWGGRPLFLWLAGGSDRLAIPSGSAYLDNLLVETGSVIEASLEEVHRFWSGALGRHFYTISEVEKEYLCTNFSDVWTYEGVAYHAYSTDSDPDVKPVYRFWSDKLSGHFYTLDEDEKDWLITQYSHIWTFEGAVFYAYPEGQQPPWSRPVYRLWSPTGTTHFYTISEAERDELLANYPDIWTDEGVAWYAVE
jgi:hypothetical protein